MATKILENILAARKIIERTNNNMMIYPGLILNRAATVFNGCRSLNGYSTFDTMARTFSLIFSVIVINYV